MTRLLVYRLFVCAITFLLALATLSRQALDASANVVAHSRLDIEEGKGSLSHSNFDSCIEQKLRLTSDFAALPASHHTMTGFYIRPDHAVTEPSSAHYADLAIRLSTTSVSVLAASHGADVITVFDGPLTISTLATGPTYGPTDFDYYVPFETPYAYDPSAGNLLVEVASHSGPVGSQIADSSIGDSILYVAAAGAGSSSDMISTIEKAMQFEFVVPEPASFLLLSFVGTILFASRGGFVTAGEQLR